MKTGCGDEVPIRIVDGSSCIEIQFREGRERARRCNEGLHHHVWQKFISLELRTIFSLPDGVSFQFKIGAQKAIEIPLSQRSGASARFDVDKFALVLEKAMGRSQ